MGCARNGYDANEYNIHTKWFIPCFFSGSTVSLIYLDTDLEQRFRFIGLATMPQFALKGSSHSSSMHIIPLQEKRKRSK